MKFALLILPFFIGTAFATTEVTLPFFNLKVWPAGGSMTPTQGRALTQNGFGPGVSSSLDGIFGGALGGNNGWEGSSGTNGGGLAGGLFDNGVDTAAQSHYQMQNFGKQQSANINMVGELLQELFATLKKLVDGQMSLNGLMMQMFGRNMEQLLEQISPALAGLWKGLAINIETAYAGGSNTLSNFGKVVDNNFAYGTNAAGGFWSTIQSAVDSTINSTLNAASHGRIPRN